MTPAITPATVPGPVMTTTMTTTTTTRASTSIPDRDWWRGCGMCCARIRMRPLTRWTP